MTAATSRLRRRGIGAGVAALVGLGSVAGLAGAAQAAPGFDPSAASAQVAGVDRFDTAARIATATFTSAPTVVIANGDRVIDAQAAGYVAGQQTGGSVAGAPILLTQTGTVPQFTLDAIKKLGATKAIVIGDNVSVSSSARAQLTAAGLTLTSIAGDNRFDTAADIYNTATTKAKTVFLARGDVATGTVSADALSAGPLAYKGTPILLTNIGSLPAETKAAITSGGVTKVVVLGNSINDTVKNELRAISGVTVETLAGDDRSLTAKVLAESSYGQAVYNKTSAAIANGDKVDALSAGPWAATKGTPILLTLGTNSIGTGTTGYLDANKATLTSATVFGDSNSVPAAFINAAKTSGGGDVAVSAGATVTAFSTADNTYTFGDVSTKAPVTVTYTSNDRYTVDGVAASLGVFEASLSVGDKVVAQSNTPTSGITTYALTNVATSAINSGLVSGVNTSTNVFDITDPVTGTSLRNFDYSGAQTFYTVGGANSTLANFEQEVAPGDSVTITGAGTAASPYTVALTKGSLTGTIASITTGSNALTVKTSAGATIAVTYADTDTFRVDGAAVTVSGFEGANVVTVGDTVTITRTGGSNTVNLTNAASTAYTGVAPTGQSATSLQVYVGNGSALTAAFNATTSNAKLTVDGALVSVSEFNDALTAGDELTIRQPDGQIDTVGSVALVNKPLAGKVGAVSVGSTLAVRNAADSANLQTVTYTGVGPYASNTTQTYFLNGNSVSQAQFSSELSLVANGSKTATISIVDNGATTEYRLTSAANAAAATLLTAAAASNTTSPDEVTLGFSKPVYFVGTPAAGDFVVEKRSGGSAPYTWTAISGLTVPAVDPTVAASAATSLKLTYTATGGSTTFIASGDVIRVQLTAQGAAKVLDTAGVAATASAAVEASAAS